MSEEFITTISKLNGRKEIQGFLQELLTPTERIMLAKRLAAILMIKKGYRFTAVERALKLSPSSVIRFWKLTKERPLTFIFKEMRRKEASRKFWEELDSLIRLGLPPLGRGRWKHVFRLLDRQKG